MVAAGLLLSGFALASPLAPLRVPGERSGAGAGLASPAPPGGEPGPRVVTMRTRATACVVSLTNLCLNRGRFGVSVNWAGRDGTIGFGRAVAVTADTGYFWFFSENNVEMVIKVVDGRSFNSRFWVFAGGLTDVQTGITVTDSQTGVARVYSNPPGVSFAPIQDTNAFAEAGADEAASPIDADAVRAAEAAGLELSRLTEAERSRFAGTGEVDRTAATAPCLPSATALCLNASRFRVSAAWTRPDGTSGAGQAVALTGDTGYFWFFSANNVEMVIKVVDGRPVNSRFWVFAGGLTNVRVLITVTDTLTFAEKTYENPQGAAFAPIQDTGAFTGTGDVVGTLGMKPQLTEVYPAPDSACYGSGNLAVSWGDYDADGFADMPLLHNDGDGTFSEIPGFRSLLKAGSYHGASWGDYDDDGWSDVVILGYGSIHGLTRSVLLHNEGNGSFRDVAAAAGMDVAGFGETPIWGDFDADGKLDLYAPYYQTAPPRSSKLYHNEGGGRFRETCVSANVCLSDLGPGITPEGAHWADWNEDGYLDFYAAGHLFQNDGAGHFTDVAAASGLPYFFDEGAQFLDYNDDGLIDLYVRAPEQGFLFRNTGGGFVNATFEAGIPPGGFFWGDSWADVNNDGWPDLLYMRSTGPGLLLMNQRDGTFLADPSFTAMNVVADTSTWGDWDNDGDLDVAMWSSLCHRFFKNQLDLSPASGNSFLRVRVVNAAGHETEHGATVKLRRVDVPNPYVQTQIVDSGSGLLGQNPYSVHFGVVAGGTYEISVLFPSPQGSRVVADKTTDPRLGAIVPGQLTTKEVTIHRGGCLLIDRPARPSIRRTSGVNPSRSGDPITLDAGAGYPSYLWSTGATTRTITVSPTSQTTYSVRVPNGCAPTIGGYTQRIQPPAAAHANAIASEAACEEAP